MVSQCANPECGAPFLYMREGRLVVIRRHSPSPTNQMVELFWLCGLCADHLDLECTLDGDANVIPRMPQIEGLEAYDS